MRQRVAAAAGRTIRFTSRLAVIAAAWIAATVALAQEPSFPRLHFKVVGGLGNTSQYKNIEEPFWTRQLGQMTGGQLSGEISPWDSLGIRTNDVMQLMRLGVITFGTASLSVLGADDAQAAAIDLPALNPDFKTLRTNADAYRATLNAIYRERYGVDLLALWTYPAQVLFCNFPITRLQDLSGKRVRVASGLHADFVEAFGAVGMTLPFNQLIDALRRRSVDCAITGTLSGNFLKIYQVTSHMYALPISWGPSLFAANHTYWNRLPPVVRVFLAKQLAAMEQKIWDNAEYETEQGFACNAGRPECRLGTPATMKLVPVAAGDAEASRRVLSEVILPRWAERCGGECVAEWNMTIGANVGLRVTGN